jgi:uncharacterized membrane protein
MATPDPAAHVDGQSMIDRAVLDHWAGDGTLSPSAYARALVLSGAHPDGAAWEKFLDRLLAAFGALLIGAGIVFFVAYNWDLLGRFAKFLLIDVIIVAAIAVTLWLGLAKIAGKSALWIATVAVGALLALVGQTYQTGADSFELFLIWAALTLPWTIAARWAPGWGLFLVLVNLATALYVSEVLRPFGLFFGYDDATTLVALWGLNAVAAVAAELWGHRALTMGSVWLIRFAATLAIAAQTAIAWLVIGNASANSPLLLLATAVTFGGGFWLFRVRRTDLFVLALGALSAISSIEYFIGHTVLRVGIRTGALLILAVLLIGMSAAAAVWLKRVAKGQGADTPGETT